MFNWFIRYQIIIILTVFLLSIILISSFNFPVTDEMNWINAGKDFQMAIITLQPDKTYLPDVSPRLGVTVLWVSTLIHGFFSFLPPRYLIIAHRFIFLIINLSLFTAALIMLRRYMSNQTLLLFILYIFMNRFFPIIGRSTWLDQLLTLMGFLIVIFWAKYLEERKNSFLIAAAIFNGLVMITKYAGWYFPAVIIGLTVFYSYKSKVEFKKLITPLLIFLAISLTVSIAFYPAIWVDPKKALLLRFSDRSAPLRKTTDIWTYLLEFRLLDPILILGFILVVLEWIKKKKDLLFYIAVTGGIYILIYLFAFLGLSLLGRLNYPFLAGIYRYTFPAIPIMACYTFARYQSYIKNKHLQLILIFLLFLREIIFSPFLLF